MICIVISALFSIITINISITRVVKGRLVEYHPNSFNNENNHIILHLDVWTYLFDRGKALELSEVDMTFLKFYLAEQVNRIARMQF